MPAILRWVLLCLVLTVAMFALVACTYEGEGIVQVVYSDSSFFTNGDDPAVVDSVRLEIFDQFWQDIKDDYAYISGKEAVWDAAREEWRPEVVRSLSYYQYQNLLLGTMSVLEDENLGLIDSTGEVHSSYEARRKVNWRVEAWQTTVEQFDYVSQSGWGWGIADTIGYFFFNNFDPETFDETEFDDVMENMRDLSAILFDMRTAGELTTSLTIPILDAAGNQILSEPVISRFIEEEVTVLNQYTNEVPDPDPIIVSPRGEWAFTNPIVLLVGHDTINEGELFAAAMSQLPNVSLVGDSTGGIVGATEYYELYAELDYTIPTIGYASVEGESLQGEGLVPIYIIGWTPDSFIDQDNVLLAAFLWVDGFLE